MLPDEMMIIRNVPLDEDVHIRILSDLHVGSKQFNEKAYDLWRQSIRPKDLIVIVGDLMDNGLKSSYGSYEQTMMPNAQREYIYQTLKQFAGTGQILCCVSGNHESRTSRETDEFPLYSVLCRMKEEDKYRRGGCFVKLRFGGSEDRKKRNGRYRPTYNIAVLHGNAGGMYVSSSGAKAERFAMGISNCDLLISGHTHRPLTFPLSHIAFPDNKNATMVKKQMAVVIASSYLNYGGYALEKMLPSTAMCSQEIILSARGKHIQVVHGVEVE